MDPDQRIQQALRLVFAKIAQLGSVRQVLLWFRAERVSLPAGTKKSPGGGGQRIVWKLPIYNSVLKMLTNPIYAGAYAFGKTETRTRIVDGRARKTIGHRKPREQWTVLLRDHHPGYISWEQYERNQALIAANAHMKSRMEPKAGRGGRALLAGLLRCRRCGRMLHVTYTGKRGVVIRYHCRGAHLNHGEGWCISFGGLRPDEAVAEEILRAVEGNTVEAALEAAQRIVQQQQERRKALCFELEQARYEAQLAARRYEAVDPDNGWWRRNWKPAGTRPCKQFESWRTNFKSLTAASRAFRCPSHAVQPGPGFTRRMELLVNRHAAQAAHRTDSHRRDRGGC